MHNDAEFQQQAPSRDHNRLLGTRTKGQENQRQGLSTKSLRGDEILLSTVTFRKRFWKNQSALELQECIHHRPMTFAQHEITGGLKHWPLETNSTGVLQASAPPAWRPPSQHSAAPCPPLRIQASSVYGLLSNMTKRLPPRV